MGKYKTKRHPIEQISKSFADIGIIREHVVNIQAELKWDGVGMGIGQGNDEHSDNTQWHDWCQYQVSHPVSD